MPDIPKEAAPALNRAFYSTEPHSYLIQRLVSLLIIKEKGDQLEELIDDEFELGGVAMKKQSVTTGKDRRWRFVTTESEVVLHHVSETLLRLYLAHAERPAVPWLSMAEEMDFRQFKGDIRSLKERLEAGDELDRLHAVFHGSQSREDLQPSPSLAQWDAAADNISGFLSRFASIFLDAVPYNAAKHGLAIAAGASRLELSIDNLDIMWASGPTLDCLVRKKGPDGTYWTIETRWLEPDHSIALGIAGCHLIQLLWLVARQHYLRQPAKLQYLFDEPRLDDLEAGYESTPRTQKVTRTFKADTD